MSDMSFGNLPGRGDDCQGDDLSAVTPVPVRPMVKLRRLARHPESWLIAALYVTSCYFGFQAYMHF